MRALARLRDDLVAQQHVAAGQEVVVDPAQRNRITLEAATDREGAHREDRCEGPWPVQAVE